MSMEAFLKCLKVPRRDNMLMCLECGGIAYRNSYFGTVTCQSCGWRVSIKEYEELEVACKSEEGGEHDG